MKVTITQKQENPLLSRVEYHGTVVFDAVTPSNADVKAALATKASADESLVVVKRISNDYARQSAELEAVVYKDMAALEKFEVETKHTRKLKAEAAKKAEEERQAAEEAKKKAEEEAKAAAEAAKSEEASAETKEE